MHDVIQFVNPMVIHEIVSSMESGRGNMWHSFLLAGCMFVAAEIQSVMLGQYFSRVYRVGLNVRSALNQMVYSKVMFERRNRLCAKLFAPGDDALL